jgi:ribosomal protein L30/L7E
MAKRPSMTKSPLALAKLALQTAQEVLPKYSDMRSRHDYTQAQLFAVLVVRQFFNTDYRGIVELLQEHRQIKNALGLNKIPHFTTLQKAQQRMLKKLLSGTAGQDF